MTQYNKQTLATFFQTGDVPSGQDYANFIDSCVNQVDTSAQSIAGPLVPTELITPRVSATNANIVTLLSANSIVANSISLATNVSAGGAVYSSAVHISSELYQGTIIVSAFGTAQATATLLSATINRAQGVNDGQQTGFLLASNKTGYLQYIYNETAASANLWPCVGGTINGLGANAAFGVAAKTSYTIIHLAASAYAVK